MTSIVACEQLILGWSEHNLLGLDGFGPVAASPGWPLDATDRTGGLGSWSRFLPEGSSSRIADGEPAPFAACYVPVADTGEAGVGLPGGVWLLSKVYLSAADRPGQYYVHALWDPTGRLGPADLAPAYRLGLLHSDDQPPQTGELALVEVPINEVGGTEPTAADVTLVGHLVHAWLSGYPLIVDVADAEPVDVLDHWARLLPDSIARVLAMSTFVGRGDPSPVGVGLAVFPFSPNAARLSELLADRRHDGLGREVLGGGAHVQTPQRLRAWAELRGLDLTPFWPGPGQASERAAAQASLVERLSDAAIIDSLLPALVAREQRPVIAVTRVADLAASSTVDLARLDWAVGTSTWSRLSNHLMRVWLTGSRRPSGHLVRQAGRAPERFAAEVGPALKAAAPSTEHLIGQLAQWPDEQLEALLTALDGVPLPTGVLLASVLDRPEAVVRRVLRTHWPQLAEQADLGVLGRLLKVTGGRIFDRR